MDCTYPPPVAPGSTVALLSPSHGAPSPAIDRGVDRLRSFDLDVEVYPTAERDTEWLRDHPGERAADLHRAFRDDDVDGVVATMGGNVAHDLFSRLDADLLRENPTRFFGASDNTQVHAVLSHCGLVSFYGGKLFPDLTADLEMHPYTRRNVERALRATPFGECDPASAWTDDYTDLQSAGERSWHPADSWVWERRRCSPGAGDRRLSIDAPDPARPRDAVRGARRLRRVRLRSRDVG